MTKPQVICIVGPTASGKTGLAVELAKSINGEIISADSMQIYKNISVGTAKPTNEEMQGIKHHLIDFVDIESRKDMLYSVADFKSAAEEKIDEILNKGKVPIVVGGTGLYINSLIYNINFKKQKIDSEYRESLERLAEKEGVQAVHDILKKLDEDAANAIHPNNLKRVIRAIEICKINNSTKTEMDKLAISISTKYDYKVFIIDMERDMLYNRINSRVDIMLDQGILDEAKYIKNLNLPERSTVMQAIGYKEFFKYIDGKESLQEASDTLKQATRRYAKRQITWFKKIKDAIWINGNTSKEEMVKKIKECI